MIRAKCSWFLLCLMDSYITHNNLIRRCQPYSPSPTKLEAMLKASSPSAASPSKPSLISQHLTNLARVVDSWSDVNGPGISAFTELANSLIADGAADVEPRGLADSIEGLSALAARERSRLARVDAARAAAVACARGLVDWWTRLRDAAASVRSASLCLPQPAAARVDVLLDELLDSFFAEVSVRRATARAIGRVGAAAGGGGGGDDDDDDDAGATAREDPDVALIATSAWAVRAFAGDARIKRVMSALSDIVLATA
jgi:hypothetical protein